MTDGIEAMDNSHVMNPITRTGDIGVQRSTAENRYGNLIGVLNRMGRLGSIKQTALITRDGVLINEIPEKKCSRISAAMIAASLAAAETAFAVIRKGIPDTMVLCLNGERIIIKSAGPEMLLTAIIDNKVDDNSILPMIEETADIIKSML